MELKMPSRFWKRYFTALLLSTLSCALTPPNAHAQKPHRTREFALVANSPEFWRLVAPETNLHTMGSGFGFTEGPVWDKRGFLWVSDEETNKIFRLYPDGHRDEAISLGAQCLLRKPFETTTLLDWVERSLSNEPPAR